MLSLMFCILFSLNAVLNFQRVKILLIWKMTDYLQIEQLIQWSSNNSVLTNHALMYFTTLSVWQYSVNLAIDNIFTPSKIRIVVKGKQYGKHQRKYSEDFVTLINMLGIVYFGCIFIPQKSVQKKCTFLCISPQFQMTKNQGIYPVTVF